MSIVHRKSGEQVHVADDITVTLLGIGHCDVKLGIRSRKSGLENADAAADEQLTSIRSQGSRYYLFPQGGIRTLVVQCEKGKSVSFNGTSTLTILHIAGGNAMLRLAATTPCS